MIAAYLAGLATLPVLGGLIILMIIMFSKSGRGSEGCQHCMSAGYRSPSFEFYAHRAVTIWFMDEWHKHVTSRRRGHREAWQAWFDSLIPGGNLATYYVQWQPRYGLRDTP